MPVFMSFSAFFELLDEPCHTPLQDAGNPDECISESWKCPNDQASPELHEDHRSTLEHDLQKNGEAYEDGVCGPAHSFCPTDSNDIEFL